MIDFLLNNLIVASCSSSLNAITRFTDFSVDSVWPATFGISVLLLSTSLQTLKSSTAWSLLDIFSLWSSVLGESFIIETLYQTAISPPYFFNGKTLPCMFDCGLKWKRHWTCCTLTLYTYINFHFGRLELNSQTLKS